MADTLQKLMRLKSRSKSPTKAPSSSFPQESHQEEHNIIKNENGSTTFFFQRRSKSPQKKLFDASTGRRIVGGADSGETFFQSAQCSSADCQAVLIVDSVSFFVCKHQLAHASDYFRRLFQGDIPAGAQVRGKSEYAIVVGTGGGRSEKQQFQCFLESVVPHPVLKEITDAHLETLMRLAARFHARGLKLRCTEFIKDVGHNRAPMAVLCWLTWAIRYHLPEQAIRACMPHVARLPLVTLEENRHKIGDKVFGDLVASKLRATFSQTAEAYQTIHCLDHFEYDLDYCPICHRRPPGLDTGAKLTCLASPCRKKIGCIKCLKNLPCVVSQPETEYQALYECRHGAKLLSDQATDCFCQRFTFPDSLHLDNIPLTGEGLIGKKFVEDIDHYGRNELTQHDQYFNHMVSQPFTTPISHDSYL